MGVDLADLDGIEAFARRADEELGGIDVLVNNAGIPKRRRVQELTPEVVEAVMAINYFSPIRLTLALLPALIERSGHIVNISSIAARLGARSEAAYAASKAALTAWSESMAVDLADTEVGVHVVNPAVIDTELFHLPDNDAPIADMKALPVEAMVEPVVDQLDTGTFEIYVPEWFADIVAGKFADPDGFQQGTIEYLRSRRAVELVRRFGALRLLGVAALPLALLLLPAAGSDPRRLAARGVLERLDRRPRRVGARALHDDRLAAAVGVSVMS